MKQNSVGIFLIIGATFFFAMQLCISMSFSNTTQITQEQEAPSPTIQNLTGESLEKRVKPSHLKKPAPVPLQKKENLDTNDLIKEKSEKADVSPILEVQNSTSLEKKEKEPSGNASDFAGDLKKVASPIQDTQNDQKITATEKKEQIEANELSNKTKEEIYLSSIDNRLLWGSYKPHLLYSISQTSHRRISFGFMYQVQRELYHSYRDIKDSDIFSEYAYHDGERNAESILIDKNNGVEVHNYFHKELSSDNQHKWHSITVKNKDSSHFGFLSSASYVSLIYYFSIENLNVPESMNDNRYLHFDPVNNLITFRDNDTITDYFRVIPYLNKENEPTSLNKGGDMNVFVSSSATSVNWKAKEIVKKGMTYDQSKGLSLLPNNHQSQNKKTTFIALQFIVEKKAPFVLQTIYSNKKEEGQELPLVKQYNRRLTENIVGSSQSSFTSSFEKRFPSKKVNKLNNKCSISSLSNLLSGLSYSYGSIEIKWERQTQPDLPLFTATPSKTQFPRGFLWDEGFHGLIYCFWSPEICLKTLLAWTDTQYENGWIPREQARGSEALDYAHPQFIAQIKNEANPPTLLFHVQRLMQHKKEGSIPHESQETVKKVYPKLKKWLEWFNSTQKVEFNNQILFQWKSNSNHQGLVLGSGLDDYPRSVGYNREPLGHVDLQVWMIFFCDNLIEIAQSLNETNDVTFYNSFREQLKKSLNMFIDPEDHIYRDLVKDRQNNLMYSPHFGYVNLFPLFFGYIDENSKEFENLLDYLTNKGKLWTKYGLRSLAQDDRSYMKTTDNYWGGPIWINLNYLTLRGLKLHYSKNAKAKKVYEDLRNNLIKNICNNKEQKGYFFEQFNQDTGLGQRNYPFNGWTALVGLMIHEIY